MSLPEDVTNRFYAEQTWRQLQHERHQRFLAQLKAEFYTLRQQQPWSYSMATSAPQSTTSTVNGQRRDRAYGRPQRTRSSIAAQP